MAKQTGDPLLDKKATEIIVPGKARSGGGNFTALSNDAVEFLNRKIRANLSRAASFKDGDVIEIYKIDATPMSTEKYPPIMFGQEVSCKDGDFEAKVISPTGSGKKLNYEEDGKTITFFVRGVSFKTPWGARTLNQCTW